MSLFCTVTFLSKTNVYSGLIYSFIYYMLLCEWIGLFSYSTSITYRIYQAFQPAGYLLLRALVFSTAFSTFIYSAHTTVYFLLNQIFDLFSFQQSFFKLLLLIFSYYFFFSLRYFYRSYYLTISSKSLLLKVFSFFFSALTCFTLSMASKRFLSSSFSLVLLELSTICLLDGLLEAGCGFYLAVELDLIDFIEIGSSVFALTTCPRSLTVNAGCGLAGPDFLTTQHPSALFLFSVLMMKSFMWFFCLVLITPKLVRFSYQPVDLFSLVTVQALSSYPLVLSQLLLSASRDLCGMAEVVDLPSNSCQFSCCYSLIS